MPAYAARTQSTHHVMAPHRWTLLCAAALIALAGCGDDIFSASTQHNYDMARSAGRHADAAIEAGPLEQRRTQCGLEQGVWADTIEVGPCIEGVAQVLVQGRPAQTQACDGGEPYLYEGLCVHEDETGLVYFNDGPSVPAAMLQASALLGASVDQTRYIELFWSAGAAHDHCYHHNPITYGLSKEVCDTQFLSDLSAACAQPPADALDWFSSDSCETYAAGMYSAVQAGGDESFSLMNTRVAYPPWVPVWQQLGLPGEVMDTDLKAHLDSWIAVL